VRIIESDSGRLIRVVNELLEWGRLQAGQLALRREPLSLQALIDEVFMLLRPVADCKAVRLLQDAETQATVQADRDKLKQVLINLVENAVKFSDPQSRVCLRVRAGRTALEVMVDDEGPGVAPEDLPHLFERFFRGRGSQAAAGSGLGLAIARNLARLHGGDIEVQPGAGRGSTFRLTLPAAGAAP
jgi:signal transduction histidine kinase